MATNSPTNDFFNQLARKHYFVNPNMIEFLLADNLALKTLLVEKGLMSPTEFKKHQERAVEILAQKTAEQIEHWKNKNPDSTKALEALCQQAMQKEANPQATLPSVASVSS